MFARGHLVHDGWHDAIDEIHATKHNTDKLRQQLEAKGEENLLSLEPAAQIVL